MSKKNFISAMISSGLCIVFCTCFFSHKNNLIMHDSLCSTLAPNNKTTIPDILSDMLCIDVPDFVLTTYSQPLHSPACLSQEQELAPAQTSQIHRPRITQEPTDAKTPSQYKKKIFYTPEGIYIATQKPNPSTDQKYNSIVWDVCKYGDLEHPIFSNVNDVMVLSGHNKTFFNVREHALGNAPYKLYTSDKTTPIINENVKKVEIVRTPRSTFIIVIPFSPTRRTSENPETKILYEYDETHKTMRKLLFNAKEITIHQGRNKDFVEIISVKKNHYVYTYDLLKHNALPVDAMFPEPSKSSNPWDRIADNHMRGYTEEQYLEGRGAHAFQTMDIDGQGFVHLLKNNQWSIYDEHDLTKPLSEQEWKEQANNISPQCMKTYHEYENGCALMGNVDADISPSLTRLIPFIEQHKKIIKQTYGTLKTYEMRHSYLSNVSHIQDYDTYIPTHFKHTHVQFALTYLSYSELRKLKAEDFESIEKLFRFITDSFFPPPYTMLRKDLHTIIVHSEDHSRDLKICYEKLSRPLPFLPSTGYIPILCDDIMRHILSFALPNEHQPLSSTILVCYVSLLTDAIPRAILRNQIFIKHHSLAHVYARIMRQMSRRWNRLYPAQSLQALCDNVLFITPRSNTVHHDSRIFKKLFFAA